MCRKIRRNHFKFEWTKDNKFLFREQFAVGRKQKKRSIIDILLVDPKLREEK